MGNEMFEFRYVDKKKKEKKSIYAREETFAEYVIGLYNQISEYNFVKKKFGFKKKVLVSIDPAELEDQQMDTAQQMLITRAEECGKGII